jgi:Uma2 family endonuclease
MAEPAPENPVAIPLHTVASYFGLVDAGILKQDDRVELLEGVVVSMSPHNPPHAASVHRVYDVLIPAVGGRAAVRVQLSLVLGPLSVPEPDVAVVAGCAADYQTAHPTTALLAVEVADSSLGQDRITKAAIYATAGIPEYWIVNLRDDQVEVLRLPEPAARRYTSVSLAGRGQRLELVALPGVSILVDDLLPRR